MANSETERQNTIDFFKNTLQTRLNDPKNGAIIIVMQRLHEMDLTGYVLAENLGYEHLCLPAEAEKKTIITFPKSGKQLIREEGDILNPQRYDKESLAGLKKSMGSLHLNLHLNWSIDVFFRYALCRTDHVYRGCGRVYF